MTTKTIKIICSLLLERFGVFYVTHSWQHCQLLLKSDNGPPRLRAEGTAHHFRILNSGRVLFVCDMSDSGIRCHDVSVYIVAHCAESAKISPIGPIQSPNKKAQEACLRF